MKKIILIFALLLVFNVNAQDRVQLIGLHYENDVLTITNSLEKSGFYPDRKIQPEEGYTLQIVSTEEASLYSFKFEIPRTINTDVINNGEIEGGIIVLNETDFALVLPFFDNAKEIRIYDPQDEVVIAYSVAPTLSPDNRFLFSFLVALALIIFAVFYYRKSH